MLRHHPMNVLYTNPFYTKQIEGNMDDYVIIDVTSRMVRNKEFMALHPGFVRDLSPFYIGPLTTTDGVRCNVFEIYWQCSKVYPCFDDNGKVKDEFFTWRNEFFNKESCSKELMRHASRDLGYENKDCKYFLYYDKDKKEYVKLDYVSARKKVYIPMYAKLIYNSESFKYLKSLVNEGKKLLLVDFDGYNFDYPEALTQKYNEYINKCKKNKVNPTLTEDDFLKVNNFKEVVNCEFMSCGHGFVIKMLLDGIISVNEDGSINDPQNILD